MKCHAEVTTALGSRVTWIIFPLKSSGKKFAYKWQWGRIIGLDADFSFSSILSYADKGCVSSNSLSGDKGLPRPVVFAWATPAF